VTQAFLPVLQTASRTNGWLFFWGKMLEMIQERHLNVSHEKEAGELS
jgi:hypothetical protein